MPHIYMFGKIFWPHYTLRNVRLYIMRIMDLTCHIDPQKAPPLHIVPLVAQMMWIRGQDTVLQRIKLWDCDIKCAIGNA